MCTHSADCWTPLEDSTGNYRTDPDSLGGGGRGGGHLLLFVPRVSALDAVGAVGRRHRVDGRALLAGGMGRVRQAGARLAGVVVKLHQAEDEVRGHQLEPVRGIGDDIPVGEVEEVRQRPAEHQRGLIGPKPPVDALTAWCTGSES